MPNQHKRTPLSIRLTEADREWLYQHAKATGQTLNRVLTAALDEYRLRHEQALARSHPGREHHPACKCGTCKARTPR